MLRNIFVIVFLLNLFFVTNVYSHGSMEIPISRIYECYKEGPENVTSPACKAAVAVMGKQPLYDWDMVNQFNANDNHKAIIPDGTLCAGGRDKYAGLNLTRTDWITTDVKPDSNGQFTFVFRATVPHAAKYFKLYLTKDGYDVTQPLKWSDLDEPFCTSTNPVLENGRYNFKCTVPANKTGRRILYMIWQRSDSAEAFYSCSDINITNENPTIWKDVDFLTAYRDAKANSTIVFWLMKDCQTVANYSLTAIAGQNTIDQWPFYLAEKVNASSSVVHIGQLNNSTGQVTPIKSATLNKVFVNDTNTEPYYFMIDILPPGVTMSKLDVSAMCKRRM